MWMLSSVYNVKILCINLNYTVTIMCWSWEIIIKSTDYIIKGIFRSCSGLQSLEYYNLMKVMCWCCEIIQRSKDYIVNPR